MSGPAAFADVVGTREQAAALTLEPLLVLEPLTAFLDAAGLGHGPVHAAPIGDGHSNVTYLLRRGDDRFCLRRPPRGPLPPSAHDVLREARLQLALVRHGVRTPEVLAICEDAEVIGAPFYVMAFVDGHVLSDRLPAQLGGPGAGVETAGALVDALADLHAVDPAAGELAGFGRPRGYLERQLRRFSGLLEAVATRPLPELEQVHAWLAQHLPQHSESRVVHGDYRLGNVMFAAARPPRIAAILDWEMATLGDPLADLGYLTATWAQAHDPRDPMLMLTEVTRTPGFPDRAWLAQRYAEQTGRDLGALVWYETLALFKAAVFLEGSYTRYRAGTTSDPYFASLEQGVPLLARRALAQTRLL
jgi:aminoglycoside phosphotransferase (APT) family kinase protein